MAATITIIEFGLNVELRPTLACKLSMSEENESDDFSAFEGQEDIMGINLVGSVNPLVSVTCETAPFKSTVLEGGGITRRTRTLTEKGYAYQLEIKSTALKSKQSELTKLMRSTLSLRGHNNDFQCGDMSLVDVKFFGQSLETFTMK